MQAMRLEVVDRLVAAVWLPVQRAEGIVGHRTQQNPPRNALRCRPSKGMLGEVDVWASASELARMVRMGTGAKRRDGSFLIVLVALVDDARPVIDDPLAKLLHGVVVGGDGPTRQHARLDYMRGEVSGFVAAQIGWHYLSLHAARAIRAHPHPLCCASAGTVHPAGPA